MDVTGPYIDISPVLRQGIAVFPGDTTFSRSINMSFKDGQHLELSDIRTTLHVGAHTDAPSHYHGKGKSIDQRDLSLYMGPCQVIKVKAKSRIRPSDFSDEITASRILFRTDSFTNPDHWHNDFSALSAELIHFLKGKGVVLVGIDTPSVDPATDQTLESHQAIFENDMAILEGIVLSEVNPGRYQLIALPLRIEGGDASPVRAILLPEKK
jgi:arylformamidase